MDQPQIVPPVEAKRTLDSGPTRNIVDTAIHAGNFNTFAAAVQAAGLIDALATKGPFTLFAPSDDAFKKLATGAYEALLKDPGKLRAVLNYHILPGYCLARDVKSGEILTTQGSRVTVKVSPQGIRIGGASVTQPDLAAMNGIVHGIDALMLPKNWRLLAKAA